MRIECSESIRVPRCIQCDQPRSQALVLPRTRAMGTRLHCDRVRVPESDYQSMTVLGQRCTADTTVGYWYHDNCQRHLQYFQQFHSVHLTLL